MGVFDFDEAKVRQEDLEDAGFTKLQKDKQWIRAGRKTTCFYWERGAKMGTKHLRTNRLDVKVYDGGKWVTVKSQRNLRLPLFAAIMETVTNNQKKLLRPSNDEWDI